MIKNKCKKVTISKIVVTKSHDSRSHIQKSHDYCWYLNNFTPFLVIALPTHQWLRAYSDRAESVTRILTEYTQGVTSGGLQMITSVIEPDTPLLGHYLHQIITFITFFILLIIWVLGQVSQAAPVQGVSSGSDVKWVAPDLSRQVRACRNPINKDLSPQSIGTLNMS